MDNSNINNRISGAIISCAGTLSRHISALCKQGWPREFAKIEAAKNPSIRGTDVLQHEDWTEFDRQWQEYLHEHTPMPEQAIRDTMSAASNLIAARARIKGWLFANIRNKTEASRLLEIASSYLPIRGEVEFEAMFDRAGDRPLRSVAGQIVGILMNEKYDDARRLDLLRWLEAKIGTIIEKDEARLWMCERIVGWLEMIGVPAAPSLEATRAFVDKTNAQIDAIVELDNDPVPLTGPERELIRTGSQCDNKRAIPAPNPPREQKARTLSRSYRTTAKSPVSSQSDYKPNESEIADRIVLLQNQMREIDATWDDADLFETARQQLIAEHRNVA